MATTPTPAPPKGGGNVLTRKLGPFPGWVWAAIAVGGFYLWKKHEASTTAAAATTASTTAAAGPGQGTVQSSYPQAGSGYYSGPGVGSGGSGAVPTGATAATSSSYTPPTGETQMGAGYTNPTGVGYQGTIQDAAGNSYMYVSDPSTAGSLSASGQSLYWQSAPGVFTVAPASGLAADTPIYQMVGSGTGS